MRSDWSIWLVSNQLPLLPLLFLSRTYKVLVVGLHPVEVSHVGLETPSIGQGRVIEAADVPFANHVRLVPCLVHVLREHLDYSQKKKSVTDG